MSDEIAFIGDVHGNLAALRGLLEAVGPRSAHQIFLGDYINKGDQSAEVLTELLSAQQAGSATLLLGNHEASMLRALDEGDLSSFLKMGGAATIRSYIPGRVGPDVVEAFRNAVPPDHVLGLRHMPTSYETADVVAAHQEPDSHDERFRISAHVTIGDVPRIEARFAQIDTGCSWPSGRLTAFLWPSRSFVQVDGSGLVVE